MGARGTLTGLAVALVALCLGCGGGDETSSPSGTRPDDFAVSFRHVDGSLPPPYHAEWTIEIGADGSGRAEYVPDYAGSGVPTYASDFEVSDADLDSLYAAVDGAGLLADHDESDDPPSGGGVETAEITADGETYGTSPGADVAAQITGLVPEMDWSSFEQRRDEYAQRKYGEKP